VERREIRLDRGAQVQEPARPGAPDRLGLPERRHAAHPDAVRLEAEQPGGQVRLAIAQVAPRPDVARHPPDPTPAARVESPGPPRYHACLSPTPRNHSKMSMNSKRKSAPAKPSAPEVVRKPVAQRSEAYEAALARYTQGLDLLH